MMTSIFLENKYTKTYYALVEKAKLQNFGDEYHHILPKSCGGSNNDDNLVKLTYRQHFIAHMLLVKMIDCAEYKNKMLFALWMMSNKVRKINGRMYENLKKDRVNHMVLNNPMYNKLIAEKQLTNKLKNYSHSETAQKRNAKYWSDPLNRIKLSEQNNKRYSNPNNRLILSTIFKEKNKIAGISYDVISPDGSITTFLTKHECAIFIGITDSTITDVMKKNRKTRNGFSIKEKRTEVLFS